jgi:ATPase subunit of ABC transporter with duplicated ATPase domains
VIAVLRLASLDNALLEFPGCAVITSHDRWFSDRVATHIPAWGPRPHQVRYVSSPAERRR